MTDQPTTPCPGFPDQCPYLLTVPPNPPHHDGGVRCGCNARQDLEDMAVELATGLGVVDPREYKATLDRYAKQVLEGQARRLQAIAEATEAHPAEHAWAVELYDPSADEWVPGTRYKDRSRAVRDLDHANKIGPMWKDGTPTQRRIVRTTTTHTVEQTTTNEGV